MYIDFNKLSNFVCYMLCGNFVALDLSSGQQTRTNYIFNILLYIFKILDSEDFYCKFQPLRCKIYLFDLMMRWLLFDPHLSLTRALIEIFLS